MLDVPSLVSGFAAQLYEFQELSTLLQAFCRAEHASEVCRWYSLEDGEFEQRGEGAAPEFGH